MKTVLVVPCYNEARRIALDEFAAFSACHEDITFLFVNDGSKDMTATILDSFTATHERCHVVHLPKNKGKAEAVRQGMLAAAGLDAEIIGYIDADLATPFNEISRMIDRFMQRDLGVLIAARVRLLGYSIERSLVRHYIGRIFATAASLFLKMPVYDTQCGAKLFARHIVNKIFSEPFVSRWIFDVEVLRRVSAVFPKMAQDIEAKVQEIPLTTWHEIGGSKVKPWHYGIALIDFYRLLRKYK